MGEVYKARDPRLNRLVAQVSAVGSTEIHVRFRRKSATERHERLSQLALATRGNADRGREIYFNTEKSACIKCHRLGDEGGRIGPDLTGVGRRFSRIHLIESVLEPSRAVAPAFQNISQGQRSRPAGARLNAVRLRLRADALRWPRLFGQILRLDKWIVCRG